MDEMSTNGPIRHLNTVLRYLETAILVSVQKIGYIQLSHKPLFSHQYIEWLFAESEAALEIAVIFPYT